MSPFSEIFYFLFKNNHYIKIIFCLNLLYSFPLVYNLYILNEPYLKLKNLPSGDYLIITSQGIHLFNNNFTIDNLIYEFKTEDKIINNETDYENIALSEFKSNENYYILCLIKNYFYLFDYNKKNIALVDNLGSKLSAESYYNLIPYKITDNSLYYIIIFIKIKSITCSIMSHDIFTFVFLHYKIQGNTNEFISENEYKECVIGKVYDSSYITDSIFSCQFIGQKYLVCLYLIDDSKTIVISRFNIDKNFSKEGDYDYIIKDSNFQQIFTIITSLSFKTNNIFFCFYFEYYEGFWSSSSYYTNCAVYNYNCNTVFTIDTFNKLKNRKNFEIFYSYEATSFILLFYDQIKNLYIYEINEDLIQSNYINKEFSICNKITNFDIIYDNCIKGYNLISNCYYNNKWNIIYNFSFFYNVSRGNCQIDEEEQIFSDSIGISTDFTNIANNSIKVIENQITQLNIVNSTKEVNTEDEFYIENITNKISDDYEFGIKNETYEKDEFDIVNITNEKNNEDGLEPINLTNEIFSDSEFDITNITNKMSSDYEYNIINITNEIINETKLNISKKTNSIDRENITIIIKENRTEELIISEKEISGNNELLEEKTNALIKEGIIKINGKEEYITNLTKEELLKNIDNIIDIIEEGVNYHILSDDYSLKINPTNSSYLESNTHVNFTECENILRDSLNISSSKILTFLQLEIYNHNEKSLTNKVEYQVYYNKTFLDLSVCRDSNIQIFHEITNTSLIDIDSINTFKQSGIDIFNINDSFFNDICFPYSDSKNDVILKDRIADIYQNYSLCDEECTYNEINTEYMTISCDCKVKTNISINESSINLKKLDEIKTESNFGLIKCYKLVFSLNGKLTNIGFLIFLVLVLAQTPFLIFYFYKGTNNVKEYIISEMAKNGYINRDKDISNIRNGKIKNEIKYSKKFKKMFDKNSVVHSPPRKVKVKKHINAINNIIAFEPSSLNNLELSE